MHPKTKQTAEHQPNKYHYHPSNQAAAGKENQLSTQLEVVSDTGA